MRPFVLLCCALIACSDESKPGAPTPITPGPPTRLRQIIVPAAAPVTSTQKLIVQVIDASGLRVPGAVVNWSVVSGGGVLAPVSSTADTGGVATTSYTLAETAGAVRLRATLATSATQDFDLKALPGPLAELTPLYTDLSLRVGATFVGRVRAIDGYGNGIPGVLLTSRPGDVQYTGFTTTPASPGTQLTDSAGYATFIGIVSAVPGLQNFLIDGPETGSDPYPASAFFAWFRVRASADQGIITPSGGQRVSFSASLGATVPVGVVVIRADGQPAANVPVTFSLGSRDGSVIDASGSASSSVSMSTDTRTGLATVMWHVPSTAGTYLISVTTPAPNDGGNPLVIAAVVH